MRAKLAHSPGACTSVRAAVAASRLLLYAVAELVVVALVADEDVEAQRRLGRPLERAHRDGDLRFAERVPEEPRAAGLAEAAAHLLGGLEPGQVLFTTEHQRGSRDVGRC